MLYLYRQLLYASTKGSTLYEQTQGMEQQLSQWKRHRDRSIHAESERFKQALKASKMNEVQQIQQLSESKTTDVKTAASAIHKVKAAHEEELRLLEIEHRLEQERIEEAMSSQVVSALREQRAQESSSEEIQANQAKIDDYRVRSQKILSWYCTLSQSSLDELVNGCQHLKTFGAEAPCLNGDEGLPTTGVPDLHLTPNVVANNGLKHVTVVKFDSPIVSRSIASLARMHMANNNTQIAPRMNAYGNLPPSDVYRGATVLMHPWLGFFYRVRVPVSSGEVTARRSIDQHSYRQECFRRPWALLSTEDRSRAIFEDEAVATSSSKLTTSSLRSDNNFIFSLRGILILHGQSRVEPLLSLIQSVQELSARHSADVQLIVSLCPMSTCLTKGQLLLEWKKSKFGKDQLPNNVIVRLPPSHLRGKRRPKHDLWSTWRTLLADALTTLSTQEESDVPIVVLDGHTSRLPLEFVNMLSEHLHVNSAGKHAYLPMSTYKSPTHRWKELFFDAPFAKSGNILKENNQDQQRDGQRQSDGYTERWITPIAFRLKDGLAAMSAWPEDEESPRASGSGIAACGRITMAWVLQSRLGMTLRRSMVMPPPELHGWDSKKAENMASVSAKEMRIQAAKQHHEDVKRIKDGDTSNPGSNNLLLRPPLFFPKDMSPTMVSPEAPASSSEFCNLALDALGLCETCGTDVTALMTNDVTSLGEKMLRCSSILGDHGRKDAAIGDSRHVYRTLNPLHGLSYDTNGDSPLHYEWSLGEPDVFV